MNAISLLSLAITYGALASLTTGMDMLTLCKLDAGTVQNIDWYESNEGPQDGLDFNGFAMVGLGIGLSLQAFVSTCSLCKSGLVGTWSSHPLTVVKVYTGISSCESKSERSLSDSKLSPQVSVSTRPISGTSHMEAITDSSHFPFPPSPTNPESLRLSSCASQEISLSFPQSRQPSMLSMLPSVCRIQYLVWAFFGAFAIWSGAVAISDSKTGRWSGYLSNTSTLEYWKKFGLADFDFSDNIQLRYQQDLVGLCIQIAVQSSITFGLHCTELVINVSRDETNWRKASTVGIATEDNSNPAKSFTTSWQSMTLMVFKSVIQWVFGYAFIADDAVDMGLLPLATMTGLFLLLAIFTEYLVRRRPKGYQPATYGDIQWMAYFIDEWDHKLLFWGDKGEIDRGIRKAGTAGHRLSDIRPDVPYVGLTME